MEENNSISPREVKEKIAHKDSGILLVDVRDRDEYNDWNIKGSTNVPVNSQISKGDINEIEKILAKLPTDKQIVTICARGINSQVAAAILRNMNHRAVYMQKGMKGWNENFDIYEIKIENSDAAIFQFVRIGKGCLSYIVTDRRTKETAVFDPSVFTDEYSEFIRGNNLKPKYVIDTHCHADHFSGAMALAKTLNVDYYVNEIDIDKGQDYKLLQNLNLKLGSVNIEVMKTPGHTDGSLCFFIDNKALLCGDLLLLESVGRPDLARSIEETKQGAGILFDTLREVIDKIDDSVKVLPAHFVSSTQRPVTSTLGHLRQHNKALTMQSKDSFINYITQNMPLTPPNYESIKKYNKNCVIVPVDYAEELEIGPNRCAAKD